MCLGIGCDEVYHPLSVFTTDGVGWQTSHVSVGPGRQSIFDEAGLEVLEPFLGDSVQEQKCLPALPLSTAPEDCVLVLAGLACC